ncbi:MAG: FtsQ-type POTRA domain-containing protein [Bacilli bacterium]|jgi:cell division protein FtsQ|uniref:Cell division protein DivIB n=1 Tax=Ureibacillus suwonensis TaxID=313007 RepID=A0ABW0RB88_9BACL|nr:cell division protein DivIB [Bacilli bacterium]
MDKVIDIEERIPTLKKKRRRRTNIKFAVIISLFLGTLFLLLYFQSPYSNIQKITVHGAELATEEYYLNKSGLQVGDSLWGFKASKVEQKLKEDWVKEVKVKRKLLTAVEIQVKEYRRVAYIFEDHQFHPILENGVVYKASDEVPTIDAPIFLNFEDEKLRKMVLKELAELDDEVLALISQINLTATETDPYAITLFMNDGYEVRAEITSLSEKLKYYPAIIAQIENAAENEKGIIDIEVGSYFKPYSEEYKKLNIGGQSDDASVEQDVEHDESTP